MGYFNVDMISDDIVNKFTILKGQRENLEKQIQLRMKALMIAAYGEWERQANAYFSVKSNATRYLEGLYLDLSDDSEPIVSLKDGTLGSMLEGGYGAFDMMRSMRQAAFTRGGKVTVPLGDKGTYTSFVTSRPPLPPDQKILALATSGTDEYTEASASLQTLTIGRTIDSTATGTKAAGVYAGGTPKFVTITTNSKGKKAKDMWKIPSYKGAMLAQNVVSYIEQRKSAFTADIFSGGYFVNT